MTQRQSYDQLENEHSRLDTQLDQLEAAEALLASRMFRQINDFISQWNYPVNSLGLARIEDCIRDAILEVTSGPRQELEQKRDQIAQELESRDANDLRRDYFRSVL